MPGREIAVEIGVEIEFAAKRRTQRVGERLGNEVVLGFEMTVKAAMGQPRRLHDLRHGDGIEALLAKEQAGRVQDAQAVLRHLFPTDLHVPFSSSVDMGSHRSEEHTSKLQSLMRISYAVFCLK